MSVLSRWERVLVGIVGVVLFLSAIIGPDVMVAHAQSMYQKVVGAAADGAAVAGAPVRIAGKDGSGNTQDIITDSSGELQVDVLSFPDNEPVNVAQINGVAPTMGNGASGTGVQRMTIANDSTGVVGLNSGTNNIGDVDVDSLPAAGTIDTDADGLTADATLEAATSNLRLLWWTARENAGTAAAASFILRHGVVSGTCTGNVIAFVELAADESAGDSFDTRGLAVPSGVCVDWEAGTIDVNIATVVEAAP